MSEVQEEIVEKAARAIWMVGQDWNDPSVFEDMPDYGQDVWRDRARAALLASGLHAAIEARDKALERVKALENAFAWFKEVYPGKLPYSGVGVEMTFEQFNAGRVALGMKPLNKPRNYP